MSKLILVANIKAVEGKEVEIKAGLQGLVAPTLQEEGCIKYELHQDIEDPTQFVFIEEWESMEHLKEHSVSEHVKAFGAASKGKIAERKLFYLNKV